MTGERSLILREKIRPLSEWPIPDDVRDQAQNAITSKTTQSSMRIVGDKDPIAQMAAPSAGKEPLVGKVGKMHQMGKGWIPFIRKWQKTKLGRNVPDDPVERVLSRGTP